MAAKKIKKTKTKSVITKRSPAKAKKIVKKTVKKTVTKTSIKPKNAVKKTTKKALTKKKTVAKTTAKKIVTKSTKSKIVAKPKTIKRKVGIKEQSKTKTKKIVKSIKKPTNKKPTKVVNIKLKQATNIEPIENISLPPLPEIPTEYNVDQLLSGPSKFEPYHIESTEDYMNEQQRNHFIAILDSWKQDLMSEVDHTINEMKEADVLADLNDRASQEEAFNLELRTRDRERKLIKKIETALQKINSHEYGYCDSCGIEIGIRRLEARPTATLCIECKTLAEIREKRV